jgi:hypothetical protein
VKDMVVFFEDGSVNNPLFIDGKEILTVDAGMGFSNCRKRLRYIKDNYPFDTEVYTNSLDAFSNFWSWDEEKKMPMIYIRNENGKWTLIWDMTDRELRLAHNLAKMYVNGVFCNVEQ